MILLRRLKIVMIDMYCNL